MQTFPRRGVELSYAASIRFGGDNARATYVRSGWKVQFANGWEEERETPFSGPRFDDITASFALRDEDKNVVFTFLNGLDFGEWFTLEHPALGTSTVKLKTHAVPIGFPVIGEYGSVWTFDLVFQETP